MWEVTRTISTFLCFVDQVCKSIGPDSFKQFHQDLGLRQVKREAVHEWFNDGTITVRSYPTGVMPAYGQTMNGCRDTKHVIGDASNGCKPGKGCLTEDGAEEKYTAKRRNNTKKPILF